MNSVADAGSASVERLLNLRPKGVGVSIKFASREPRGLRGQFGDNIFGMWGVICGWAVAASIGKFAASIDKFGSIHQVRYASSGIREDNVACRRYRHCFGNTFYGYEEILLFQQGCRNCRKTLEKFAAELGPF